MKITSQKIPPVPVVPEIVYTIELGTEELQLITALVGAVRGQDVKKFGWINGNSLRIDLWSNFSNELRLNGQHVVSEYSPIIDPKLVIGSDAKVNGQYYPASK